MKTVKAGKTASTEKSEKLAFFGPTTYARIVEADGDFLARGEPAYFGFDGLLDYLSWLRLLKEHARGDSLPPGWTAYEMNALVDSDGKLLCLGQLRFGDGDCNCTWAGHVGYTVPPSLRGQGCATRYLRLALERAWGLGFARVMLTCDTDNLASKRVIEKCGGEFLDEYHEGIYHKLRYWFYPKE